MILKSLGILVLVFVLIVAGYLLYVITDYKRIEDNKELKITTYNIGFGAYSHDFSFFMDGGKYSRAIDKQHVLDDTNGAIEVINNELPDFALFQEVDTDGDRSRHVDQVSMIKNAMNGYDSVFACNYHSAYLFYPPTKPIGKATSGICTFSRCKIESSLRRSFPISMGFPDKFVDLDRCYSITRIPTDNGKYLVLFNVHMSAYTDDDSIRTRQVEMLFEDMKKEYDDGNYVICGGDYNHDMLGNSDEIYKNEKTGFNWTNEFPEELKPDGFTFALSTLTDAQRSRLAPTCRNTDKEYSEDNEVWVLDTFIVSDNITINNYTNIDAEFMYSDHNPVCMKFTLSE